MANDDLPDSSEIRNRTTLARLDSLLPPISEEPRIPEDLASDNPEPSQGPPSDPVSTTEEPIAQAVEHTMSPTNAEEPPAKRQKSTHSLDPPAVPAVTQDLDSDDESISDKNPPITITPTSYDKDTGDFDEMAERVNAVFDDDENEHDFDCITDHRIARSVLELEV